MEKATQNPGNVAFIAIKKIKNDEETLIPLIKFSNTYPSNENLSDLILSYTLLLFVYFFRNILNINSGIQKLIPITNMGIKNS